MKTVYSVFIVVLLLAACAALLFFMEAIVEFVRNLVDNYTGWRMPEGDFWSAIVLFPLTVLLFGIYSLIYKIFKLVFNKK